MPLSEYHFILTGILRSFLTTTGKMWMVLLFQWDLYT